MNRDKLFCPTCGVYDHSKPVLVDSADLSYYCHECEMLWWYSPDKQSSVREKP